MADGTVEIEFSYTGEKPNRQLWASMAGSEEEIRCACTMLLLELREVNEHAAIWCDSTRFKMTSEDLDRYNARLANIRKEEIEMRKNPTVEEEKEEEVEKLSADDRVEIPLVKKPRW